jgi:glutamate racemase
VRVISQACPDFIPLVEGLKHNTDQAFDIAEAYIRPLLLEGCDQIVLGCTHFSFLRSTIEKVIAGKATVIDTADAVALELGRRLSKADQLKPKEEHVKTDFWTSCDSATGMKAISALWGSEINLSDVKSVE